MGLKAEEFDAAVEFISGHLQSEVGTWNEDEVINALKDWRLTTRPAPQPSQPGNPGGGTPEIPGGGNTPGGFSTEKKSKARVKVNNIMEVAKAKQILHKLIDLGYDQILNTILDE